MAKKKMETKLWSSLKGYLEQPWCSFGLLGAIAGTKTLDNYFTNLLHSPEHLYLFTKGFGAGAQNWIYMSHPILGALVLGVGAQAVRNIVKQNAWTSEELQADRMADMGYSYVLPPFPSAKERGLSLILGESHGDIEGGYNTDPTWCKIPAGGLWGNIVAFGGIGTGKTAGVAYPVVEQMFEYARNDKEKRMGGLVLDEKGDFVAMIEKYAKEFNREKDLLKIRPGGEYKWNPIHVPSIEPEVIAGRLLAVHENMTGGSGEEGQWVNDGIYKIFTHAIGIHRLCTGYVTLKDINYIIEETSQDEEQYKKDGRPTPTSKLIGDYRDLFNKRVVEGEITDEDAETLEYHCRFFEKEWASENPKNKGTMAGAAKNITGIFANPKNAKTFCPAEDDISFPGFDAIIDEGWIVCLDAPGSEFGNVANALGILLKLEFQRSSLARVSRSKNNPETNTKRPLLFCCDEYQNFVSTSSKRSKEGDDNFYALARQSRCLSLVLTQGPVSLFAKMNKEKTRTVLASLCTKIFFKINDYEDAELAANIFGKDWKSKKSTSFNENMDGAKYDVVTDSLQGKTSSVAQSVSMSDEILHRVDPVKIQDLKSFECFVSVFDGTRNREAERVYLKPYFCPEQFAKQGHTAKTLPYKDFIEWFETVQEED